LTSLPYFCGRPAGQLVLFAGFAMKNRPKLKRMLYFFALLLFLPIALLGFAFWIEPGPATVVGHVRNPALKDLLTPAQWPGTPVDQKGNFVNHEHPFVPRLAQVLKWQTQANPGKAAKKSDTWQMPVVKDTAFLQTKEDVIVWLGHASYYVRLGGVQVLIDPIFGGPTGVKRLSELPLDPDQLRQLDYILVSHNHRDHCDEPSVKRLAKNNPQATWLTGLKLDELLREWTGAGQIQAAGWYQQYQTDEQKIRIYYLPARHWARRGLTDTNTQLWGAYVLQTDRTTIYFSGDTGYGSHLAEVGRLFPQPDYCIIGVGAYKPEWFMGSSHISPTDAVRAFHEMGAKTMIPMHYGTFDLADEAPGDPRRVLENLQKTGQIKGNLQMLDVGQVLRLE
jgi:L-ascorbate metabolism protein UlaG (beta-lactamase superfamily)